MLTLQRLNFNKLIGLLFTIGTICLLIGMVLSVVPIQPGNAWEGGAYQGGALPSASPSSDACGSGWIEKDEIAPFAYNGQLAIDKVSIYSGGADPDQACIDFLSSGTDGCYVIWGLGTKNVQVEKTGSGADCKEIASVTFYALSSTGLEPETVTPANPPSPTPTRTPLPPSPTAAPPTEIPPTATQPPPTPTPAPPTEVPETQPPTETDAPAAAAAEPGSLPPPDVSGEQPRVFVPQSGADSTAQQEMYRYIFFAWGIGILGLTLILYGINRKMSVR